MRPSIYYFSADLCPAFGERALGACSSHCFCNLNDGGGGGRGTAEHEGFASSDWAHITYEWEPQSSGPPWRALCLSPQRG